MRRKGLHAQTTGDHCSFDFVRLFHRSIRRRLLISRTRPDGDLWTSALADSMGYDWIPLLYLEIGNRLRSPCGRRAEKQVKAERRAITVGSQAAPQIPATRSY